jgi:apolipoprotein N-acyltransferase
MCNRIFLLLLLLGGSKLFAQTPEEFTAALMQTKAGAKMVYTSDKHSVILDIISNKIEPTQTANVLNVDSKPLQIVLLPNSALSLTDTTLERQKAELLGYVEYETNYVKNEVKLAILTSPKNGSLSTVNCFCFGAMICRQIINRFYNR